MFRKVLRGIFSFLGLVIGVIAGFSLLTISYFTENLKINGNLVMTILFILFCSLVVGLIMFLLFPSIYRLLSKIIEYIEKSAQKKSANELILGTIGAIVGLIISTLIVSLFANVNVFCRILAIVIDISMAALGADIGIKKREDITSFMEGIKKNNPSSGKDKKNKGIVKGEAKVLDTSVIIDGRIFDICQTGFVEGTLVIPNFVLEELRHIADSSDSLKRNRGRRGLDILNRIQKELNIEVKIYEKDFPELLEVDTKLLKLAEVLNGKVVTNDYNLNKVAEFQGVSVLNINELANAVKPVVMPGEEMTIQIIKDGKENGQGVAYLDDGTMIVVEGGKKHIGEVMEVVVTSVLQTAAGRMIFSRQKEASDNK